LTATLRDIVTLLEPSFAQGDIDTPILGVSHDSRKVRQGWLFVAARGGSADGHDFIDKALASGASAILAVAPPSGSHRDVPWIVVPDTRLVLGAVSSIVYGRPTLGMKLVGITGTNGKTTLTFLLEAISTAAGYTPGVIGTITYRWGGKERAAGRTTPEASDLQEILSLMQNDGVTHVFMEVSSHGLCLGRLDGCHFDVRAFTNLTQDHLDFHGTMEEYYLAKRLLFSKTLASPSKGSGLAVVNGDDPYGRRLISEIESAAVITYGASEEFDVHPLDAKVNAQGIDLDVQAKTGRLSLKSKLTGPFNVSNILAAVAVAEGLGIPKEAIGRGIEQVESVPGRLERVPSRVGTIFVDYAHTPSALKNVLEALGMIRSGRIITVMGCGGDRDTTKRPVMGMEAAAGSDLVVVTSDNPRTEDPMHIICQVEEGVRGYGYARLEDEKDGKPLGARGYRVIPDRREAIAWAVRNLRSDDILLVAGKGHETYQEINGVRYPFDDRDVVTEEANRLIDSTSTDWRSAETQASKPEIIGS
jgi:UDP-N-acetylmuramoyl-L-alanyl-D-glutamate--2,6-diaminopimelate ligase